MHFLYLEEETKGNFLINEYNQRIPKKLENDDNKTMELMFVGINKFWALLRFILSQAFRRGLKRALRSA